MWSQQIWNLERDILSPPSPKHYKTPTSSQSGMSRLHLSPTEALPLGNSGDDENFASPPAGSAFTLLPEVWGRKNGRAGEPWPR